MARFYSSITSVSAMGSSKPATIGRTARNYIEAHTRGWNMGVHVHLEVDENGCDVFHIYKTGGTENPGKFELLESFTDENSAGPRDRKGRLK